jgi:hypothetical protein
MTGHRPWREIRRGPTPAVTSITEAGGPTVRVEWHKPGHNPDTCGECQREREREEALMRDEQLLDVQTSER